MIASLNNSFTIRKHRKIDGFGLYSNRLDQEPPLEPPKNRTNRKQTKRVSEEYAV